MNEYCRGAVEALAWVQFLLAELEKDEERWEKFRKEMNEARDELMSGVAVDFREKLRL